MAAVAVVLLGRDDACRGQLRQALQDLGADVVHEGEIASADVASIIARRPSVVIVNLEAGAEDALDGLDPLFEQSSINVVFNEAETTSQLSGWDLARWARHLASKVLGSGDTAPPAPAGSEALPLRDLQPVPGAPRTPAQEVGDISMAGFTAEAADSEARVPASADLSLEAAAPIDLDSVRAARQVEALAVADADDSAAEQASAIEPTAVTVDRVLHGGPAADDDFSLDLGEIEQALAGLDSAPSSPPPEGGGGLKIADEFALDLDFIDAAPTPDDGGDAGSDATALDSDTVALSDFDSVSLDDSGASPVREPARMSFDADPGDVDLSLDADVAALAAQFDAHSDVADGSGRMATDDSDSFDLRFDEDDGLQAADVVDLEDAAAPSALPSLDFDLMDASLPVVDASTRGDDTLAGIGVVTDAADPPLPPARAAGSLGELSLADVDDAAAPASATAPAKSGGYDFSSLSLSLEPIDDTDGGSAAEIRSEPGVDSGALSEYGIDPEPVAEPEAVSGIPRVIVLGASIGGPDALRTFLSALPADFPALFVLAQHLDNGFFSRLATQLQKICKLPIRVADDGAGPAAAGQVLIVPSSHRFLIDAEGTIEAVEHTDPPRYKPSIDNLMIDVAEHFGPRTTAIIFSGMAGDAIEGAVQVTQRGGEVWAQDPASCVVSSMVDGARARGVVEFIGSPRELAERCVERFGRRA